MSFKGTLRRTLALLLVLIFALSNMGLAEMAEQLAESIPEAEPKIEETADVEAASEPTEDAQAAPVESAPAAEQEEAAPAAESVSVFVQAIDETELCAYETIEPAGAYDVSYMWERAESADGEWTALDETSDVLQSEAEDRAAYVYRCTVTVDGISATSDPATFDWGVEAAAENEAAETIDVAGDLEMVELATQPNQAPTLQPSDKAVIIAGDEEGLTIKATAQDAENTTQFIWTIKDATGGQTLDGDTCPVDVAKSTSDSGKTNDTVTLKIKSTAAEGLSAETGTTIKVNCQAAGEEGTAFDTAATVDVVLLPAVPSNMQVAIIPKDNDDAKTTVDTLMQPKESSSSNAEYKAFLPGISSDYGIVWSITGEGENAWAEIASSTGIITVKGYTESTNAFTSANADGHTVSLTAKVGPKGKETPVTGSVTILPEATGIAVTVNGEPYEEEPVEVPELVPVDLEAALECDTFKGVPDLKIYGEGIEWSATKGEVPEAFEGIKGNGTTCTLTPDAETATYTVTASDKAYEELAGGEVQISAKKLATDVAPADGGIVTILASDKTGEHPLTLKFTTDGEEADDTYQVVDWAVKSGNAVGKTGKFIKLKDEEKGTIDAIEEHGSTLTVMLDDPGDGTEAEGGPVIVEASTLIANATGTAAEPKTVQFKINVEPISNVELTSADIKIDGDAILGQPAAEPEDGAQAPDWSKLTAYIDKADFAKFDVEWDVEDDTTKDTIKNSKQYAEATANSEDDHKAEIRAFYVNEKSDSDSYPAAIDGAEGKKITIKATVLTGAKEGAGTTAYKEITIYPQAKNIYIGKTTSTNKPAVAAADLYTGATQVLEKATGGLNLLVTLNDPINADDKTKYIDTISKVTVAPLDEESGPGKAETLKIADNGVVQLASSYTGKPGSCLITVTTSTGVERELTLTFLDTPTTVKLFSEPLTTVNAESVAAGKQYGTTADAFTDNAGFTLDICAYALTGSDEQAYDQGKYALEWSLAPTGTNAVTSTEYVAKPIETDQEEANSGKIYLTMEGDGKEHAKLHIGKDFKLTSGTKTFRLNVQPGTSSTHGKQITFTVRNKPTEGALSTPAAKFTPSDNADGHTNQTIIQGETITLELVDNNANDQTNDLDALKDYTIDYTVTDNSGAEVSDWISVKKTSNTKVEITAEPAGDKNKLASGSKNVKLVASIAGLTGSDYTRDIPVKIVAAPDHMDISLQTVTKEESGDYKHENATNNLIPLALPANGVIYLKPELAWKSGFDSATRYPKMTVDSATLASIENTEKKPAEGATKAVTFDDCYTLTAKTGNGTVKVTATYGDVSKTIEIKITNETITAAAEGDTGKCPTGSGTNAGKNHVWELVVPDANPTPYGFKADADGHYYKCKYCNAESKAIPHAHYSTVVTDSSKKEADVQWYPSVTGSVGYILCDVCGYVCPHTNFNIPATATRSSEGDYHTATCAICGVTLKQKHDDNNQDGVCNGCGGSTAEVTITNEKENFAVVGGKAYTPKFQIAKVDTWDATFTVAPEDTDYITVDANGAVTATAVKTSGPAKVNAEFTVTVNGQAGKTTKSTFDYSYEVETRNSTGKISVTADAAHMSDDAAWLIAGEAIKLTATAENADPYLENFQWKLPAGASNVSFVKEDKDGKPDTGSTITNKDADEDGELLLHKQSIWLYVDESLAADLTGDKAITITYAGADPDAEKGEIKIEALTKLKDATTEEDTKLKNALTFGDEYSDPTHALKIIEGQSISVSMKTWDDDHETSTPFDARYGDVTFAVEPADGSDVKKADVDQWIEVKDNNTIETHKGMLKATDAAGKSFVVSATIVTDTDEKGNETKAVGKRTVTIMPAPSKIDVTYGNSVDTANTALPTDKNLSFYEGVQFSLKADLANENAKAEDLTWTVEPASAVKDVTDKDADKSTRTYEINKGASDFTVTISGYELTKSVPIDVKKLITGFTFEVKNPKVAIGEKDTEDGGSSSKVIEIAVSKVPADADDEFSVTAYPVETDAEGKDQAITSTKINGFQQGDTEGVWVYSVPKTNTADPLNTYDSRKIMIVATANFSKEADPDVANDTKIVERDTIIELYKRPVDAEAFKLETSKAANGDTLTLTKGASVTITEHGYDTEAGYGSSDGALLDVEITDEGKNADGTATEEPIIKLTPNDDNTITLTAVGEGTAKIAVHSPINYNEQTKEPQKELTIEIGPEIDSLIETKADTIKAPYDIKLNQSIEIPKDAFTATRTTEADGTQPVNDGSVQIELKAVDSTMVSITDTKDHETESWTVTGLAVGSTELYAAVGTAESEHFTVNIKNAPTGINFTVDGKTYENGAQIAKVFGKDTEPIEITAHIVPDTAEGTISLEVSGTNAGETAPTGSSVTITPAALGTTQITAKVLIGEETETETPLNPQYLRSFIEILVTEDEQQVVDPEPPVSGDLAIEVVDKQAIGPGETTRVVVTGVPADASVTWSAEPETAATIAPNANDAKAATVTYVGAGKATVTATVGAQSVTKTIYTLTAPTKVELHAEDIAGSATTMNLAIGETIELFARIADDGGYDFATPEIAAEAEAEEVYPDVSGLFTFSVNNTKALSISPAESSALCFVTALAKKAKKDADPAVTVSVKGSNATASIGITVGSANKSFNIGAFNGSTLYMMPGQEQTIDVTTNPKSSKVNLAAYVEDVDEELYDDETGVTVSQSDKQLTIKVADDATTDKTYNVRISAIGYDDHAPQSFKLIVLDEATAEDAPILAVRKVDAKNGTGYKLGEDGITTGKTSVTVAKGEKLQAYFIDKEGKEVAGSVDWTQINKGLSKADKKKISISATGLIKVNASKGSMTLNASVSGQSTSITLNFTSAPKVELDPAETTRKVAVGEEFPLMLKASYPDANANEWYTISFSNDLGFAPVGDEEKPDTYTFSKAGTTKATLQPVWGGKAKTVSFTVVSDLATSFEVPEVVKVPSGIAAKTIVHATLIEEGSYANLTWLDGTTVIGTKDVAIGGDKNFKVKKLDNNELQITTTKNATGTKTLTVKGPGAEDGQDISISVEAATNTFPEGTAVVFGKKVITVGESTTVGLDFGENEAPVGKITYSYDKKNSDAKVSVKGNVVKATGTKAGVVTVKATIGSGKDAPSVEGKLYVVKKAEIVPSMNPTKMGENSTLCMDITIRNYANTDVPEEYQPVDTTGILSVETSSDQILAELEQEDEEHPNTYVLTLKSGDAVTNTKGKYATTTVKLRLTNGATKTMKIQVVEKSYLIPILPESITVAQGMKYTLFAANTEGANCVSDLYWYFDDESAAAAAKAGLTIENGKLCASTTGTVTPADEPVILYAYDPELFDAEYDDPYEIPVYVVSSKAKKGEFTINLPNRALYAGESILATVKYNANVGAGDVTWKSNRSTVIAVDKATGLLTVKGPYKKYTNAKITATANKKSVSQTYDVVAAPTTLAFDVTELPVALNAEAASTVDLAAHLQLDGKAVTPFADYKNIITIASDDFEIDSDGVLTVPANAESGTVAIYAYSYNGLEAKMLLVLGNGAGGGEVVPPVEPEYEPETVELYANGISLSKAYASDADTLVMDEGDQLDITALVRDKNGVLFTPKTTMTWKPQDNEHVSFSGTGLNATLTATKATNVDGAHTPIEVSFEVAKQDGTTVSGKFYVTINYKLREENVDLTFEPSALLVGSETPSIATFAVKVDELASVWTDSNLLVEVENLTPEIITLADDVTWSWTVSAKAAGEGQIKVTVSEKTSGDPMKLFDFTKTFTVNDLPNADEIKIMSGSTDITDGTLSIGAFEAGKFEIVMPESFQGEPSADDVTAKITKAEPDTKGEYTDLAATVGTVAKQPKLDEEGNPDQSGAVEPLKWTVVGKDFDKNQKFRVEVELYKDATAKLKADNPDLDVKPITKSFTVELGKSPANDTFTKDITVTATPAFELDTDGKTPTTTVKTGVNQEVTLEAVLAEGMTWTKGLEWTWDDENTYKDLEEGEKPVVNIDEAGVVQFSSPVTGEFTFTLGLKGDAAANRDDGTVVEKEYQIVVSALPTADTKGTIGLVTAGSLDGDGSELSPYIIGKNEKAEIQVNFDTSAYTTDVKWTKVSSKIGLSSTTGSKTTISGVDVTGKNAAGEAIPVTLEAYAGDVQLGETTYFVVVDAPSSDEVVLKDYAAGKLSDYTSEFDADDAAGKYVAVSVAEGKSATFELEANNDHISFEAVSDAKNVWKIVYGDGKDSFASEQSVTLTVVCKELNIRKNYNLNATTGTFSVQVEGLPEPTEVESPGANATDPGEVVVPEGFKPSEGGPSQPQDFVTNQTTITKDVQLSADGKTMTITLSGDVDKMAEWDSSEKGSGQNGNHWYLLVIDSGAKFSDKMPIGFTRDPATPPKGNGHGVEAGDMDDVFEATDDMVKEAHGFGADADSISFIQWIDMDLLKANPDKAKPCCLWKRNADDTAWELYMTVIITYAAA